jgi:hypothetical protein
MKKIRLSNLCKNYLDIKSNQEKIKKRESKVIDLVKYFSDIQDCQFQDIIKYKSVIIKVLLKINRNIFRNNPDGMIPFTSYAKFKDSLFTNNHLFYEKPKNKSLNSYINPQIKETAKIKNNTKFGNYCERALSPYFQKSKLRFSQKIGKEIKIVGEPDFSNNEICYEFKAISYKDRFDYAFKLAYCQANLGLILTKPSYNSDHTINLDRTISRNKNIIISIDIFFWFEDRIYRFDLKPDFQLGYDIYLYGKRTYSAKN